jgi:hypothetical protein
MFILAISSLALASENKAYRYLYQTFDQYHQVFYVCRDADSGGNHFIPSGWMGDIEDILFEADSSNNPHSPPTCIKITYLAKGRRGNRWAGIYWQFPENNWGKQRGLNLSGAKILIFWARGERGGEKAEFKVGGIGSENLNTTGVIALSREWRQYRIPLTGLDLDNLIGGFCWVTNILQNPNGATIYLDDIYFDLDRPSELRFLQSFEIIPAPEDMVLRNVGFSYDNALVLLAFLARGETEDLKRARILADSFVFAQNNDRSFSDGRLRNAYQSGDLRDPLTGKARLPGWLDKEKGKWFEDKYQVSTHSGNLAWAMIVLLEAHKKFGDEKYLKSALRLGQWVENNCRDSRGKGGYSGGFEGWEEKQTKLLWKSTEHNIDLYVAFRRLYEMTRDSQWQKGAEHALRFVEAMWNEEKGHFWTGTLENGVTINQRTIPLDVQTWAILGIKDKKYNRAVEWNERNCLVIKCPRGCGTSGFDFNNDRDGVWFEGTAQQALAYGLMRNEKKYQETVEFLNKGQSRLGGLYASCHDGLSTGFDWKYNRRTHLGATCWYIFAKKRWNPYWGEKIR